MDFKKIWDCFAWKPTEDYQFSLPVEKAQKQNIESTQNKTTNKNVSPTLSVNLEYIKTKYNTLINSDIIIREFILSTRNKQYKAFLFFIDGMVDSNLINNFILKPLMLKNSDKAFYNEQQRIISEEKSNNITVRKVKKFDITEYISNSLLPQNTISKETVFEQIISGINSGNCALFVDTLNFAFNIEVKGFKQRSIDSPNNEIIIKGPQEAFVENIRTNTSLLRRIANNENLIIENIEVGSITKTKCAVCYMKNIANDDLVAEIKYRLNNIEIDSLLSSGQLEQLIINDNQLGIPEIISTERPDKTSKYLLQGRVIVLVNRFSLFINYACNIN